MGKEECVSTLCEDREKERGSTREKVRDKERGRDERDTEEGRRRKERRRPVLIGLCGHAGL